MQAHWIEWLNLALRWVHMIVGIAWGDVPRCSDRRIDAGSLD